MNHNILYYTWNENSFADAKETLIMLGNNVFVSNDSFNNYDNDDRFINSVKNKIKENNIDIIYSFNYFPDLSRVANETGIRYVSWIYDSPHRTLDSITLCNSCNTVNIFDYELYNNYKNLGINTVRYMPLAVNTDRLSKQLSQIHSKGSAKYVNDITFLGSLYNDKNNYYSQINYLPEYIKGFFDGAIETQSHIYGMDLISVLIKDDILQDTLKYLKIDMGPDYRNCQKDIVVNMLQKSLTVRERHDILKSIGENYKLTLYSDKKTDDINADFKGYASYLTKMPEVFATSKINLNITLRSIVSGIPLRVMDIIGAKGFCISNYQAELSQYFTNNESIVWFEDLFDLHDKTDYYLKNDSAREAIIQKGYSIIEKQFSYKEIMPKLFEL